MELYSVNRTSSLSKSTMDRVRKLVLDAKGPVVLPLYASTIAFCRLKAKNARLVEALATATYPLEFYMVAILALAKGKTIVPFYTSDFARAGRMHGNVERIAEVLREHETDHVRVRALQNRATAYVTAVQMLELADRWERTKPVLVIAEDNFARTLGPILRTRVHRLTRDDRVTRKIVRRTLRELPAAKRAFELQRARRSRR